MEPKKIENVKVKVGSFFIKCVVRLRDQNLNTFNNRNNCYLTTLILGSIFAPRNVAVSPKNNKKN